MPAPLLSLLLWFSTVACGILAGVYFAFSTFVMSSLDRLGPSAAIAAMNAMSVTITRSLFMPLFMVSTLCSLALIIIAAAGWVPNGSRLIIVTGSIVYVAGMFGVTALFNVPLNDGLAAFNAHGADAASTWAQYLQDWTRWNHVRTVASCIGMICYAGALVSVGSQ
ncbi:MAG: anthrone oxygenase family protein [Sphingobium sp.]|uniref:DUF1772 domain-containing protein n=1 Tax=Sphingobium sp. TaxID=1912891 RepID=UPI003BB0FFC2